METVAECQICFNPYGARRRSKLLACGHSCCCRCLAQLWRGGELRCPWCRALTRLPPGVSPAQLPDDPLIAVATALPRSPVFVRLAAPLSPLMPGDAPPCHFLPGGHRGSKTIATVSVPEQAGQGRGQGRGQGSTCTAVCTGLLVACVLLFLLVIVLHNMSCISKRFTVISCG